MEQFTKAQAEIGNMRTSMGELKVVFAASFTPSSGLCAAWGAGAINDVDFVMLRTRRQAFMKLEAIVASKGTIIPRFDEWLLKLENELNYRLYINLGVPLAYRNGSVLPTFHKRQEYARALQLAQQRFFKWYDTVHPAHFEDSEECGPNINCIKSVPIFCTVSELLDAMEAGKTYVDDLYAAFARAETGSDE